MPPLSCREVEYGFIVDYIEKRIRRDVMKRCEDSAALFVAGVCGSGKTATLREVGRDVESCKFVHITLKGLSMNGLIDVLSKELCGNREGLEFLQRVCANVNSRLPGSKESKYTQKVVGGMKPGRGRKPIALVVDEADSFELVGEGVMAAIVEASLSISSGFALILVSNSKGLPFAPSRFVTELIFTSYSAADLKKIVTLNYSQRSGRNIDEELSEKAVNFAVKSVWNADARKAIGVCSSAVGSKRSRNGEGLLQVSDVTSILQQGGVLQELEIATPMVRELLRCCVLLGRRNVNNFSSADVAAEYKRALVVDAPRPSKSEIDSSLGALCDMNILSMTSRKYHIIWPLDELEQKLKV